MVAHLLKLGRVLQGGGTAIRCVHALEVEIAAAIAWLLAIAPDFPSLAFVAGNRDIAISLGSCVRWSAAGVGIIIGLAFIASGRRLRRIGIGSVASHAGARATFLGSP